MNDHPAERTPGHREVDPCRSPFGEHRLEENLGRIQRRAEARAIDDLEFERRTFAEEREALGRSSAGGLGEPFDVSGPPEELVGRMLERLGRIAVDGCMKRRDVLPVREAAATIPARMGLWLEAGSCRGPFLVGGGFVSGSVSGSGYPKPVG